MTLGLYVDLATEFQVLQATVGSPSSNGNEPGCWLISYLCA